MKKSYTASFKAQAVLELLKETKTLNQLAAELGGAPSVLREWKLAALRGSVSANYGQIVPRAILSGSLNPGD